MSRWNAYQPACASVEAWAAIDQLAHEYVAADPNLTQARADAMMDLILQRVEVQTTVTLAVPTDTSDPTEPAEPVVDDFRPPAWDTPASDRPSTGGPAETSTSDGTSAWDAGSEQASAAAAHPATARPQTATAWRPCCVACNAPTPPGRPASLMPGPAGWILAATIAALLDLPSTRIRLASIDPTWSAIHTLGQPAYRPKAALDRAVRERDRTCRFPGCATPARRCDLDHVLPYPTGPTSPANLLTLCRRHHGFKHHARWTVAMAPDGQATWTSPTGRTHTTQPPPATDLIA